MNAAIGTVCWILALIYTPAAAPASPLQPLPEPAGPVLLSVTGRVAVVNGTLDGRPAARFDRGMLDAMPRSTLITHTDWTEGEQRFEGVLLRDLMDRLGAEGTEILASALNEYAATLPWADLGLHPVLLATLRNGAAMPVRDKGPIWIVYPTPKPSPDRPGPHNAKMVWQLNRLDVR